MKHKYSVVKAEKLEQVQVNLYIKAETDIILNKLEHQGFDCETWYFTEYEHAVNFRDSLRKECCDY
jgi:hypothetical protein